MICDGWIFVNVVDIALAKRVRGPATVHIYQPRWIVRFESFCACGSVHAVVHAAGHVLLVERLD